MGGKIGPSTQLSCRVEFGSLAIARIHVIGVIALGVLRATNPRRCEALGATAHAPASRERYEQGVRLALVSRDLARGPSAPAHAQSCPRAKGDSLTLPPYLRS